MLANWGLKKLAGIRAPRNRSTRWSMRTGSRTASCPLTGCPNFQAIGRLRVGEDVEDLLKADLALEHDAIPLLKEAIAHCESVRDFFVSRDLFADSSPARKSTSTC